MKTFGGIQGILGDPQYQQRGQSRLAIRTWTLSVGTLFPSRVIFSSRLKLADQFRSWVFEEVLPAIRGAGKLEASLRQELVLKDKQHQEELNRAMRALAIKDKQLAAKDALTKKVKKAYKTSSYTLYVIQHSASNPNNEQQNKWTTLHMM